MGAQQPGTHFRRESNHSVQSEGPGGHNRGNFPQGGRNRGSFNPHNNYNHQMGYPPNNQYRNGPAQGRNMPAPFQPQGHRNMAYPNSPQPNHRSPAMVPSMPGTPNMPPSQMQPAGPPTYGYGPAMPAQAQQPAYGYPPSQLDQYGRPYNYAPAPYMHPPQANSPGYNPAFVPPPYHHQSSHSMSRTSSQQERPPSANQHGPAVAVGSINKQTTPSQSSSEVFSKPGRKSAAIPIKTASGEVVEFKAAPASPAPSSQHTKTPPVASSNPTPPPKPSTPSHSRTDSHATQKTAKEIQQELREKIMQATQAKDAPAPAPASQPAEPAAPAATEPKAKAETSTEAAPAEKPSTEAAESKTEDTTKVEDAPKKEDTAKKAEPEKPSEPAKDDGADEDEMERIIREMEEEDARREKEEAEHRAKVEAEKAAAKIKAEEDRKINAAEEDRRLREQEREMERLEEEKERKRREAESSGKAVSLAEALAGKTEADSTKVDSVSDKLAGMKISDDKAGTAEKRAGKPAALNLTLNTKPVEPPQPSAALQSLKSARFLQVMDQDVYPEGIKSPNPALNAAVTKKGKTFKYDASFLLQFQKVFTEQPSVEFHAQVKNLIGDSDSRSGTRSGAQTPHSARQSSRGGGGFAMGAFNAPPGGRTLPTGSTSEQRFAMASGNMARPQPNPMNSFNRPGGAFPMSSSMSRSASQGMGSNTPRQGSRRGGSRRDNQGAKETQAANRMPLTAGMEVKPITISSSGWKPISVGRAAAASATTKDGHMDPEMVQRKVKAALNKMTPENFDRISDQILVISSQSKDETDGRTLRQVIQLTFEKATDEAHWASMYAKFCKKMLETMSPEIQDERIKDRNGNTVSGGNLFRKYLLNRCQEEFERGWKTKLPEKDAKGSGKPGEAEMLSEEYYAAAAAKRRGLGLVQFIGELYKLGMLTERIMIECVHKLVDYEGVPDEAEIESLSKLLRTIGANLDASEKGRPMMEVYFGRIKQMMDHPELPSRLRFMLMDVVDLRKANWVSKEANKGPKTLEEVRAEAEAAQAAKAQEAARSNQRGGGRPPPGRGDSRNFSAGYQQTSNQVGMDDLRRLKGTASRSTSGNVQLGPTSMFSSRSNSGRRGFGRPGEDSGASSRTGTPPTTRDDASRSNAFSLLANMETEHPASPPSTSASPAMSKAVPDSGKKDGE